jgi:hypothetical protein
MQERRKVDTTDDVQKWFMTEKKRGGDLRLLKPDLLYSLHAPLLYDTACPCEHPLQRGSRRLVLLVGAKRSSRTCTRSWCRGYPSSRTPCRHGP